jgi:hypothetical protein
MVQPLMLEGEVPKTEAEMEDEILNYYQTIFDIKIISAVDGSIVR